MTPRGMVAFIDTGATTAGAVADAASAVARADVLGHVVSQAFVMAPGAPDLTLPRGWAAVSDASDVQVSQWAFDAAAQADVPLLVVMGPLCPARELVGALLEALDVDPLFGMAIPRVAAATGTGRVLSAPGWDTPEVTLPLRVLAHEPEYRVLADVTAPVMLFRRELIGSLAYEAGAWRSVRGAVADFTVRARRAGFRAVLCNRALVEPVAPAPAPTGLDPHDRSAIHRAYPELDRANAALVGPELRSAERPLAAAFDAPDSLLLDARNLVPFYNGTSAAILGMADAIHRVRPGSEVSLWLQEDVAAWHELAGRYPGWRLHHTAPPPPHAAAIRLSQPWHISEVESLAEAAAVNVYWMLDTIAWDIVYTAPCGLDHVWTRVAAEADALLFISEFSRRRFENRFGEGTDLHTGVCRLSLVPDDYLTVAAADRPEGPYWLVVGNQYDHKHIGPTVDLLTRSFPRQRLVVFGDRHQVRTPQVTRFDSGPVEEAIVQGCFAGADLVVFPSFYEGFGLPMVQGLSRGRTVVVRASQLVDELAARYRGPGRLVTFTTDRELVDVLNRLTRGDVPESVPLGTAPSAGQWTWDAAARTMLALTRQLVGACPSARMRRRTGMAGHGLLHPLRRPALTATDVEPATPHP